MAPISLRLPIIMVVIAVMKTAVIMVIFQMYCQSITALLLAFWDLSTVLFLLGYAIYPGSIVSRMSW